MPLGFWGPRQALQTQLSKNFAMWQVSRAAAVEEGAQSREDVQQTEQSNNMQQVLRDLPPLRGFNPIHRVSSEPAVHLALDQ